MTNNPSPPQWPQDNRGPMPTPGAPQAYPPQGYGPAPGAGPKKGFPVWVIVLIVVGVGVVVMGGILASLAIFGVRRYVAVAKTAEARNSLMQIRVDAVAAYEKETTSARGDVVKRLCPSATASVPASMAFIKGAKYQSSPAEWQVDRARNAGFACLGFSMATPQYFLYRYTARGFSRPGDSFEAEAVGDLAGDGVLTRLRTSGTISPDHVLEVPPNIVEVSAGSTPH